MYATDTRGTGTATLPPYNPTNNPANIESVTQQTDYFANLCSYIADVARGIDNLSERIKGKLFGASPQGGENVKEPCCIEDVLIIAKATLDSATKTLADIDSRL